MQTIQGFPQDPRPASDTQRRPRADDRGMGRLGIALVAMALLGVVYLYGVELGSVRIPGLPASAAPETPAYVERIGTPAPVALPEADPAAWFVDDPEADPYDPVRWREVDGALAEATTPAGWAALCAAVTEATGADRTADPLLGALACSGDPALTALQEAATRALSVQAAVALWMRGVPGYGPGAIEARQSALRHLCDVGPIARDGLVSAEACALALDASWRQGDGPATFDAAREAYRIFAEAIAARDPDTAGEPATYDVGAGADAANESAGQEDAGDASGD